MGKSNSKLSAESLERLKQPGGGGSPSTYSLNEKELRNLCQNFNKDFPDAQLTDILDNEHLLAPFLTDVFYQEVEVSDCMQTLFRGNCLAKPHIRPLLPSTATSVSERKSDRKSAFNSPTRAPPRKQLSADATANIENTAQSISTTTTMQLGDISAKSNSPIISYEIDSSRLEEDGDIDVNQRNLLKLTKQILDSILSSAADFPPQLNSMCICLRQVLCEKYPNSNTNLKAVGTVIFLRFINPAIVSPYEAGIVDQTPPQRTLRGLMLVSKILQNIANNVEFSKEEHMLPFNDFVRAHFEPMRRWVSEISTERNS